MKKYWAMQVSKDHKVIFFFRRKWKYKKPKLEQGAFGNYRRVKKPKKEKE